VEGRPLRLVHRPRHQTREPPLPRSRPRRAGPLRQGLRRRRVQVPLRLVALAGEAEEYHKGPLSFFDDQQKKRFIPYVIEPSAGVDRSTLAFLVDAYDEEEVKGQTRNLLRFHPSLAPTKVAVFPLVKKEGMPEIAHNIANDFKKYFTCFYDEKGAVGRRYRRQDEAGTPFCVTVDGQTLEDQTVTVRERAGYVM